MQITITLLSLFAALTLAVPIAIDAGRSSITSSNALELTLMLNFS